MKDLSLHIMDIAQNSVVAGASDIAIRLRTDSKQIQFEIDDNGRGMSPEFLAKVTDPFTTTRTTRSVGLGIPLIKMAAEMTGGTFSLQSEVGVGTWLKASFVLGHIDRIPVGDIAGTMATLIMGSPLLHWQLCLTSLKESFLLDTDEIRAVLGDVPLDNLDVNSWMEEQVREAMTTVFGGVLDEIIEGS